MATTIKSAKSERTFSRIPKLLAERLPYRLTDEIRKRVHEPIEEIRLRAGRCASLTLSGGNLRLQTVVSGEELSELVVAFCGGSLYAYRDTIARGYLTLADGIRVGICGRAAVERDAVIGVYDISSLNIRLPTRLHGFGAEVCGLLQKNGGGVLIYAPPGEGKTTLLRSVAVRMASGEGARRVVLIDTRGELGFGLEDASLTLDLLVGYPRALGVEIAARTMNAQLILCDELGEISEARAILSVQNCGVPFVATAHGDSVAGILRRTGIGLLHEARVFDYYVGIRRARAGGEFFYTITDWETANGMVQTTGSAVAFR